jgi:hypothetical protein
MSTRRRARRFEKSVEPRIVTYRLTRFVAGQSLGIELCVARETYEDARSVVARRLLRARTELGLMAMALATTEDTA